MLNKIKKIKISRSGFWSKIFKGKLPGGTKEDLCA
jgi:hypothetical protein